MMTDPAFAIKNEVQQLVEVQIVSCASPHRLTRRISINIARDPRESSRFMENSISSHESVSAFNIANSRLKAHCFEGSGRRSRQFRSSGGLRSKPSRPGHHLALHPLPNLPFSSSVPRTPPVLSLPPGLAVV